MEMTTQKITIERILFYLLVTSSIHLNRIIFSKKFKKEITFFKGWKFGENILERFNENHQLTNNFPTPSVANA